MAQDDADLKPYREQLVQVALMLKPTERAAVLQYAESQGISMNAVYRAAILQFLDKVNRKPDATPQPDL